MENYENIALGEGEIEKIDGAAVAIYKDEAGNITKLSAKCKHKGCTVSWNKKEKTWDCPCHGSRYKADGAVFHGPAAQNLDKI